MQPLSPSATDGALSAEARPAPLFVRALRWALIGAPTVLALVVSLGCLRFERWAGDTGLYAAISAKIARGEGAPGFAGWWTLHVSQDVYFNKPPLMFWVHAAFMRLLGYGPVGMYLPEIAAYVLTVIFTQLIAQRLGNQRGPDGVARKGGWLIGSIAGLLLVASGQFLAIVDTIKPDYLHNLFLFISVWMVVVAMDRLPVSRKSAAWWAILSGVPVGLAMLIKPMWGLAGYIPLMLFLVLSPRIGGVDRRDGTLRAEHPRQLCVWMPLAALTAVLMAAPWHIGMWWLHGEQFLDTYFVRQTYNRVMTKDYVPEPWHWYLHYLRDTSWPLFATMVVGGMTFAAWKLAVKLGWCGCVPMRTGEGRVRGALLLGACWAIFWLVVLSVVPDKRRNYSLHVFPALAMVGAALVAWPMGIAALRSRMKFAGAAAMVGLVCVTAMFLLSRPKPFQRFVFASAQQKPVAQADVWEPVENFLRTLREPVYVGALMYPDAGRLYVRSGVWPLGRSWGNRPDDVIPAGALVIYDSRVLTARAPSDAAVVFEHTIRQRRIVIVRRP